MASYKFPQALSFLLIAFIVASLPDSVPARCLPTAGAPVAPSLLRPGVPYYMRPVNLFPPEANTNGFGPHPNGGFDGGDCKYKITPARSNTNMVPVTFSTLTGEPFVVDDFFHISFNITLPDGTVDTTWGQGPSSPVDICVGGKSSAGFVPTLFKVTSTGVVYSLRTDLPFPDLVLQRTYLYTHFSAWHRSNLLALGPDQIQSLFRFFAVEENCDVGIKSVV